jgi:D-serine deaminase-like pyridoxal phosphate-dependent protein
MGRHLHPPAPGLQRRAGGATLARMTLDDLPTPCLVLDRGILARNLATMAGRLARHAVPLRPHLKTAKCIEVARMALEGQPGGITVSTVAEAEYFAAHGITDILLAAGITPQKLAQVVQLNALGADVMVITDDADMAAAIGACVPPVRALIEIDTGEGRGGLRADDPRLGEIASRLGASLQGVMTHAGHSYAGRSPAEMAAFAETERAGAVAAAERLRALGHACPIVSAGSTPTALYAESQEGLTEIRAGVYMFGDLFQAGIGSHGVEDIAMTVLTSVIGRREPEHRLLLDAGGLALSKDRSTEALPQDDGFGLVRDLDGRPGLGRAVVSRAYQEHGVVELDPALPFPDLGIGGRVRVLPNHTCMTAAAHDRYYVVDGGREVVEVWTRVNGW